MGAPLVPAEVDLRGTAWMPYFGHLLRGSELNATISDAGFRAAHNLWWAAWNEVPAASLPDNDRLLTRFADLGTNVNAFVALKNEALHGFIKCSDGRLYHQFLAGLAIETWETLGRENARRASTRNRVRRYRERHADVTGYSQTPSPPSLDSPSLPPNTYKQTNLRAHAREEGLHSMNRKDAAPPPPVNPKFLNHGDACMCANCTRWAAQQHERTA